MDDKDASNDAQPEVLLYSCGWDQAGLDFDPTRSGFLAQTIQNSGLLGP